MSSVTYQAYENMPKGKIAAIDYKEPTQTSKGTTRRRRGTRLTQKRSASKVSPAKKAETGMIAGKKYFIEDKTRRNKEYKVVYTGTYVDVAEIGDELYLNFKGVKILVNPFNSAGTATGFSPSVYKFIEQIE